MELAPVLASLPASTSLHRLAGFLTGSLEARCVATIIFILSHFKIIDLALQMLNLGLQMLDLTIKMVDLTLQMPDIT